MTELGLHTAPDAGGQRPARGSRTVVHDRGRDRRPVDGGRLPLKDHPRGTPRTHPALPAIPHEHRRWRRRRRGSARGPGRSAPAPVSSGSCASSLSSLPGLLGGPRPARLRVVPGRAWARQQEASQRRGSGTWTVRRGVSADEVSGSSRSGGLSSGPRLWAIRSASGCDGRRAPDARCGADPHRGHPRSRRRRGNFGLACSVQAAWRRWAVRSGVPSSAARKAAGSDVADVATGHVEARQRLRVEVLGRVSSGKIRGQISARRVAVRERELDDEAQAPEEGGVEGVLQVGGEVERPRYDSVR